MSDRNGIEKRSLGLSIESLFKIGAVLIALGGLYAKMNASQELLEYKLDQEERLLEHVVNDESAYRKDVEQRRQIADERFAELNAKLASIARDQRSKSADPEWSR